MLDVQFEQDANSDMKSEWETAQQAAEGTKKCLKKRKNGFRARSASDFVESPATDLVR